MKYEKYKEDRERLSAKITKGYWPGVDVGNGWMPIIIECDARLEELEPGYEINQIK